MLKSKPDTAQAPKRLHFISHVCKSLLWEDNLPKGLQYFFLGISYIQVISILIWGQLQYTVSGDKDSFSGIAHDLSAILATRQLIDYEVEDTNNQNIAILAVMVIYFSLFLVALGLIIKSFILRKNLRKRESFFITLLGQLHLSVGFWISTTILMDYLQFVLVLKSGLSGTQVPQVVISWILIVLSYTFGFLYAFFSYDPFMTSNVLSSHSTACETTTMLFHSIIAPLLCFSTNRTMVSWTFVVFSMLILGLRYYYLLASFPYYRYTTMKIAAVLGSICIAICIVSCIGIFVQLGDNISARIVYIDILIVPLCLKLATDYINSVSFKYFALPMKNVTSRDDVFKKLFSLSMLLRHPKLTISTEADRERGEIKLWGLLAQENQERSLKKVRTYMRLTNNTNQGGSSFSKSSRVPSAASICNYYTDVMLKIKKRTLQEAIEKFRNDRQLKVNLAYLALTYNSTPSASLLHLIGMDHSGGSIKIAALKLHEKLQKNIDEFFNQNRGRILDLQTFIELETISAEFIKLIHSNAQKNQNYWITYGEPQVQVKELNLRSQEIEEEADIIQSLWKRHTAKHKVFAKSQGSIYSMYLSVVRNTPYLAHKVLHSNWMNNFGHMVDYDNNDEPLSETTLMSSNVLSFYASMSREKPGKVVYASPYMTEALGWSSVEVIGHNISGIMPHFMRDRHDQMLVQHMRSSIDSSSTSKMYKNIETFILEKSGHILPCEVYVSIHPAITEVPMYISLVKVKRTQGDQILFNDLGMIEGFTRKVGKMFGLRTDERAQLQNICKNYSDIEEVVHRVNPRKSILKPTESIAKSFIKQIEKDKTLLDSIAGDNENQPKNLMLEFYTIENEKTKAKQLQTYSGVLTPYYYIDTCYFVLCLDQNIAVKDSEEKYKVQTTLMPQPTFYQQMSLFPQSTIGEKEDSDRMSDIADEKSNIGKQASKMPLFANTPPPGQNKGGNQFKKISTVLDSVPDEKFLTTTFPMMQEDTQMRAYTQSSQKDLEQILTTMNDQKEIPIRRSTEILGFQREAAKSSTLQPNNDSGEPSWNEKDKWARENSKALLPPEDWENGQPKDPVQKIVDLNNRAASSVGSSFKAEMVKLEQAVHVVPMNNKLNALNLLFVLFMFFLAGPLVGFQVQSFTIMDLVQSSVEVLSKSIFRLVRITDVSQYTRCLLLANNGMFASDRYESWGYTDTVTYVLSNGFDDVLRDLNDRNNELRSFVYQLDKSLQVQLYQDDVPILEMDFHGLVRLSNRTSKAFDLITSIVSEGSLILTSGLPLDNQNPHMLFCLNNTYNQLLVSSETTVPILVQDNKNKLDIQLDYLIYSMAAIGLAALFVLGFFYNINQKFVDDRNQFISILLSLDRNQIQTHIYMLSKFSSTIEKSAMNGKRLQISDNLENYTNYTQKPSKDAKDSKFRKKVANTGGINGILTTLYISLVFLLLAMYSAFPVLLAYTDTGNSGILTKMQLLITSNQNLYNINSLANTIYEYISENITTYTRNKPIKQDFEQTFQQMTMAQDFVLYDLLDPTKGVGDSAQLRAMALGSLCDNIQIGDDNLSKQCKIMGGGVCEKGIVGLNSYLLAQIKSIKDFFDNSDRSVASMKIALSMQGLINIEVFYPFTYQAFVWIDNLLKEHLASDFDSFKTLILRVVVVYIVGYFLLATLVWRKIRMTLENEMAGWRKMMRQIPQSSIVTNKRLRRYLAKNSDGILDVK